MRSLRKLSIFLLVIISAHSCSDDFHENIDGGNILVGVWNSYYESTDSLVLTRVFTPDYYSYFTFSEGLHQNELNKQSYSISDDYIFLDNYTQKFRIEQDTLWITNSKGDQVTKYIYSREQSATLEGNETH